MSSATASSSQSTPAGSAPVEPVEALVIVDTQSGFVVGDEAVPDAERLLPRVEQLLAKARAAGSLVIQLQNDGPEGALDERGTPTWETHFPVDAERGELVFHKTVDDGFEETELEDVLRAEGIGSLALCGVMSEMCVSATARTALDLGFRVVIAHDAHATYDIPAAAGISDAIPAATVSRVAEWALGDEVEIVPSVDDVGFVAL
ncbi:isochorismatase family protein [Streptomyces lasiicapitis]|uniref:isochorismatase family protein n=1 Tax=Streptomyces lasiicapitis TaxID=1923961 RepID=UPI00166A5B27|nr:isochorismatase family protein [Streptomyces lasiicapitis]